MSNINKIERRIRALLTQAADRNGTPEGDTFQNHAFELMARYSVSPDSLKDSTGDEMTSRTITITGTHSPAQHTLAHHIGTALNCHVRGTGTGRKVRNVIFYGKTRHIERAAMLFAILNPHMIAGANRLEPSPMVNRATQKRSWMAGFSKSIYTRLKATEKTVAEEVGRTVALVDDAKQAESYANALDPNARELRTRQQFDPAAAQAGRQAADGVDLGQQRFGGRAALPAATH